MAAFNIEDLPPIWPGSRFDLATTIRGLPADDPRLPGARETLDEIVRMAAHRRHHDLAGAATTLLRAFAGDAEWARFPVSMAFNDRYGARRVLVLPGGGDPADVLRELPPGAAPVSALPDERGVLIYLLARDDVGNVSEALSALSVGERAARPATASKPTSAPTSKLGTRQASAKLGISPDALTAMRLRSAPWGLPGAATRAGVGNSRGRWKWDPQRLLDWHHAYTERDAAERAPERRELTASGTVRRTRTTGADKDAIARLRAKAPKR